MRWTSRKNRSAIVVVLFHDSTIDDVILSARPATRVVPDGMNHSAIADDISHCR
jgi:hypothetical protein